MMRKKSIRAGIAAALAVLLAAGACAPSAGCTAYAQEQAVYSVETETTSPDSTEENDLGEYSFMPFDSAAIPENSWFQYGTQFLCEDAQGIYTLQNVSLLFYSLKDRSLQEVYTFGNGEYESGVDCFVAENTLYVLVEYEYAGYASIYKYDLASQTPEETIVLRNADGNVVGGQDVSFDAVGVDANGRIYAAGSEYEYEYENGVTYLSEVYKIWLLDENGALLSSIKTDEPVYDFYGFDASTGDFFMETYDNYVYWGYDHYGRAVLKGNVTGDVLTCDTETLEYICQSGYLQHTEGAAILGGRYLATSSVTFGRLLVFDLQDMTLKFGLGRAAIEDANSDAYEYDTESFGVRAVYNEKKDSVIVYENGCLLTEYDLQTQEKSNSFTTQYPVYNLMKMGDQVIAIEKNGSDYYIETLDWSDPEFLSIAAESDTMQVGEEQRLVAETGRLFSADVQWSSSDESVLTVTESGKVVAWKEGKAVITCTMRDGSFSAQTTISVVADKNMIVPDGLYKSVSGTLSSNWMWNNYSWYSGTVVCSYLRENADGTLTRVEYLGESKVLIEKHAANGSVISSKTLTFDLSLFGGYYAGENANYLVFGEVNDAESDAQEVVRIVKYDLNWNQLDVCSVYGANTYIPFDAGSLRMVETDGKLYIHTCHEMYALEGIHHQANMTFVVNEADMTMEQAYYDIMNIAQAGYVSHSFNQYIRTDGDYVYRVDHGDAGPRAVSITRCSVDGSIEDVAYTLALEIQGGTGDNWTGVTVGGFELSSDNALIAGTSVDQSSADTYDAFGQANVFLTVTSLSLGETKMIWLTDYTESSGVTPLNPQLVKIGEDQFLMMWEEYNSKLDSMQTRMVTLDGDGTTSAKTLVNDVFLSDCQPILTSDGLVKWYVDDSTEIRFYAINPYSLPTPSYYYGDVDLSSSITATDALSILQHVVKLKTLTDETVLALADADHDGKIGASDALKVLQVVVKLSEAEVWIP